MKKAIICVLVCILLILSTIIPVTGTTLSDKTSKPLTMGSILYVGGSGTNNYTKIQDAIENASDGDTVFVYSGIYCDYNADEWGGAVAYINKSINLVGENKLTTIINGRYEGHWHMSGLIVAADGVNISGFTIQNCDGGHAAIQRCNCFNTTIYDNILKVNTYGIEWSGGPLTLYNNIICNNYCGILYDMGAEHSIFCNVIENNSIGIELILCIIDFYHNIIKTNGVGIIVKNCLANIHENNFINNTKQANFSNSLNYFLGLLVFGRRNWAYNYWSDWLVPLPKPIIGDCWYKILFTNAVFSFSSLQFDWHPAQEPYDIS
jgi:hypothetical protein